MPHRIPRTFALIGLSGVLGLACLAANSAWAASPAEYNCAGWGHRYDAPALLDLLMRPTHPRQQASDSTEHGRSICHDSLRPDITRILHEAQPLLEHARELRRSLLDRTIHEI